MQTHVDDRCVFIAGRSRDHHGAGAMRAMRAMRIVHEKNNVIYRFVHLRRVASLLRPVQTPTRQLWAEWFAQSMNDLLSNFLQCQSLPDCAASHQFYQQHKRHWNTCLYIPVYIYIIYIHIYTDFVNSPASDPTLETAAHKCLCCLLS